MRNHLFPLLIYRVVAGIRCHQNQLQWESKFPLCLLGTTHAAQPSRVSTAEEGSQELRRHLRLKARA